MAAGEQIRQSYEIGVVKLEFGFFGNFVSPAIADCFGFQVRILFKIRPVFQSMPLSFGNNH
eukprot:12088407-Karenia_brevis.AAC.1